MRLIDLDGYDIEYVSNNIMGGCRCRENPRDRGANEESKAMDYFHSGGRNAMVSFEEHSAPLHKLA